MRDVPVASVMQLFKSSGGTLHNCYLLSCILMHSAQSGMTRSISTFSKVKNVWKTFVRKTETPREIQERHDLYKIALASTYRQVRLAQNVQKTLTPTEANKSQLEDMFDKATDSLENETKAHELPIRSLRFHVQSLIQPQAIEILETCKSVDEKLQINQVDDIQDTVVNTCKPHLLREEASILEKLEQINSSHGKSKQSAYLKQKLNAIQILSTFYEWESSLSEGEHKELLTEGECDSFGYHLNDNEDINTSIRYYQVINLTKSLLIRDHLGYSTVALKSTISTAGRGVFLDGFAPAGTLINFFPGSIWPKEYLLNVKAASNIFKNDPKHQLSIRYDDILVDSRKSPYTVLDNENSNAFSIGHIVNHPSFAVEPNSSTVIVDFMERMNLKDAGLEKYVPNSYVKPPMMFGPQAMDRERVSMHGFGLVASRDIENEELFYDYRLSPGNDASYPDWYHVCDEEELKNRWTNS